ncbi:OHCU decarboxylase [Paenibacillus sp. FSL H8-0548]|uniref:2-oxo-4-hydroxy-4-carboxy-5-ureidoimidazoline decarboxylase n=1 Tax=Paenibacillus sp. FSL H8-0548 TaxID=1920422 RepID=UPI00096C8F62|nr:2-oxo-4-hydroxy-4-carboxy-5-ureidoimidazoline decarboxylase [Paenibacillus sp. FSL H8-0548]OMF24855.1 OHCU decarboxylase [Paenibacillus sp. FSL H8-0548]
MKKTLEQINGCSREQFVDFLGAIFEHSPWVAAAAFSSLPFPSVDVLHKTMINIVRESRVEAIVDLFRAHPDLGTRLAVAEFSSQEQQSAGLDQLSAEEYEKFHALNQTYVRTFGFPFILAVRGRTKEDIVAAMNTRLWHTASEEAEQALLEIEKISGFRLRELLIE